jgi:D-alanyl-D-alanine carboxypeptidase/D-alanyl-D-alanine-endopeptidase (penicillin-binding protein 4)
MPPGLSGSAPAAVAPSPAASAATAEPEHPTPPSAGGAGAPPITPPPSDPAQRHKWLEARIDLVTQVLLPGRARVGIAVMDVDSGRLLYGKNDVAPLNIASNVKLFTTAAALALLGPEYRFKTVLAAERGADRSEYKNLYLRGYGDPSLSTEDLWKLTLELTARGVKRIKGDIVIDDSFFDEQRVGPAFEQKNQDNAYRAPQGAVSLNYNAIGVRVQPGAGDGQPARIALDPPSAYFVISNEARTVATGRTSLVVEAVEEKDAPPGRERTIIRVRGTIKASDSGTEFNKRIAHPDLYAGATLLELLNRRGIAVGGKVSRGTAPANTFVVDSHYSAPLGVLARNINKHSNNFMAEQVLKSLGADASGKPGSWQKGLQAVSRYLETLGIAPGKYQMVNGSGLFDSNRFTATQVVVLLRSAYRDFRFAADFVASLALAGADGTIGHRMTGGVAERYVRAKTGTLNGISCLSGYAGAPTPGSQPLRPPLAFSILVNELGEDGGVAPAKRLQDAVMEALVTYQSVNLPVAAGALVAPPPK